MRTRRNVTKLLAIASTSVTLFSAGCTGLAEDLGLVERELDNSPGAAPGAEFSIEYDSAEGQLTVAHDGGAAIPAATVYIRGAGLDQTGSWASLSSEIGAGGEVTSGSMVFVGAQPDFEARVVWESDGNAHTYEEASGPEA